MDAYTKRVQNQLKWFVEKILSLEPIIFEMYEEVIFFPFDLVKERSDLFPLGRYASATDFLNEEDEYASYCIEMLTQIKKDVSFLNKDLKVLEWDEDDGRYSLGNIFLIDSKFRPVFQEYLEFMENKIRSTKIISLKNKNIEFDDVVSSIFIDGVECPLPPAKNEDCLAKAMFKREINETVDWSIIYKEMTGSEDVVGEEKNHRTVKDTVRRINQRVKNRFKTNDDLITCELKMVRRNF